MKFLLLCRLLGFYVLGAAQTSAESFPIPEGMNPVCANIVEPCTAVASNLANDPEVVDAVSNFNTDEVSKAIAAAFKTCMVSGNKDYSCCCCDTALINEFSATINNVVPSYLSFLLPGDIHKDPMQCAHRTSSQIHCPADKCPEASSMSPSSSESTSSSPGQSPAQSPQNHPASAPSPSEEESPSSSPGQSPTPSPQNHPASAPSPSEEESPSSSPGQSPTPSPQNHPASAPSPTSSDSPSSPLANIKIGWRIKLNATFANTQCSKIKKALPILVGQIPLNGLLDKRDLLDAASCVDFGKCVSLGDSDSRCDNSIVFLESNYEATEQDAISLHAECKEFTIPEKFVPMISAFTGGELISVAVPENLLSVDEDCAARQQAMPETSRLCTCGGGEGSPCRVKTEVDVKSQGALTVRGINRLKNAVAKFSDVGVSMVYFTYDREKNHVSLAVWLESSDLADKLTRQLEQEGQDLQESIASAISQTDSKTDSKTDTDDGRTEGSPSPSNTLHETSDRSSIDDSDDAHPDGTAGVIVGITVSVLFALGLFVGWIMLARKKYQFRSSAGTRNDSIAVGVLEPAPRASQMVEIREKRITVENPIGVRESTLFDNSATDTSSQQHADLSPAMRQAGWDKALDDEGDYYFYHYDEGVSSYSLPVFKSGRWVVPSDSEEDGDDEAVDQSSSAKRFSATKKPSLLSNSQLSGARLGFRNPKGNRAKSLAVRPKKRSFHQPLGAKRSKKSMSLASSAAVRENTMSRQKKALRKNPGSFMIEDTHEVPETGTEGQLKLTQAMEVAGWEFGYDDEGDVYFFNCDTGESSYELPVFKDGAWVAGDS